MSSTRNSTHDNINPVSSLDTKTVFDTLCYLAEIHLRSKESELREITDLDERMDCIRSINESFSSLATDVIYDAIHELGYDKRSPFLLSVVYNLRDLFNEANLEGEKILRHKIKRILGLAYEELREETKARQVEDMPTQANSIFKRKREGGDNKEQISEGSTAENSMSPESSSKRPRK